MSGGASVFNRGGNVGGQSGEGLGGDVLVASASYVFGGHGCLLAQYGCPAAPWNLPVAHLGHAALLVSSEYLPATHAVHTLLAKPYL